MKISADILEAMRESIAPLDTPERRAAYLAGEFPRADAVKDLDVRYRWDLFYAARGSDIVKPTAGYIVTPEGYLPDVTSDHIDTALRRIVPPLVTN